MVGTDNACCQFLDNLWLSATLIGAMTLALSDGGYGGILRLDDLVVSQGVPWCEPAKLGIAPVMHCEGGDELAPQAHTLIRQ